MFNVHWEIGKPFDFISLSLSNLATQKLVITRNHHLQKTISLNYFLLLSVAKLHVVVTIEELDYVISLVHGDSVDLVITQEVFHLISHHKVVAVAVESLESYVWLKVIHRSKFLSDEFNFLFSVCNLKQ